MKIGGFQKFTLIDYPGKIAAVVFTRGCNFRCGYCHNPELVNPDSCPDSFPDPISDKGILEFLKNRKGELEGVVVTGGEPLLQEGLENFLAEIKKLGYAVKLDTNGCFPGKLRDIVGKGLVDYLAMDIKAPLEKYGKIVNSEVGPEKIGESIGLLAGSGLSHEFRTTVVKSLLKEEDILDIGKLLEPSSLYVLQKFVPSKTLDPKFMMETGYPVEELEKIRKKLENEFNLKCVIR